MSEATKNLKLELPFQTDFYNVEVFNANATKIDNAVGQAAQEATLATVKADVAAVKADVAAATERIGSSADVISDTPTTLFGAVKRLLSWFADTWTVARAGKIDNLDVTVSSRASSLDLSTHMRNWTVERAGKIDRIDGSIGAPTDTRTTTLFGLLKKSNLVLDVEGKNYSAIMKEQLYIIPRVKFLHNVDARDILVDSNYIYVSTDRKILKLNKTTFEQIGESVELSLNNYASSIQDNNFIYWADESSNILKITKSTLAITKQMVLNSGYSASMQVDETHLYCFKCEPVMNSPDYNSVVKLLKSDLSVLISTERIQSGKERSSASDAEYLYCVLDSQSIYNPELRKRNKSTLVIEKSVNISNTNICADAMFIYAGASGGKVEVYNKNLELQGVSKGFDCDCSKIENKGQFLYYGGYKNTSRKIIKIDKSTLEKTAESVDISGISRAIFPDGNNIYCYEDGGYISLMQDNAPSIYDIYGYKEVVG